MVPRLLVEVETIYFVFIVHIEKRTPHKLVITHSPDTSNKASWRLRQPESLKGRVLRSQLSRSFVLNQSSDANPDRQLPL